jgi:hypothetical protein
MSTSWQTTAKTAVKRLIAERIKAFALATAILLLLGVVGLLADGYDLVLFCILALQGAIAAYLLTAPASPNQAASDVQAIVDQATARTLSDLSRTRQSILDAVADVSPRTP